MAVVPKPSPSVQRLWLQVNVAAEAAADGTGGDETK
jgi:hypothetical protein